MVSSNQNPKILLVDVDEISRGKFSDKLQHSGFSVFEALDASSALDLLSNNAFDLILIDSNLPGSNVADFLHSVHQLPRMQQIPILLLTPCSDIASIKEAYKAGITDFINKSDDIDLGVERIRYVLRNSQLTKELSARQKQLEQVHKVAKLGYWRLGYWRLDLKNRAFFLSDEAKQIFGIENDSFDNTLMNYLDLIHVSDRDVVKATINNCLYDTSPFSIDHRIVNSRGAKHYVHTQGDVSFDEGGKSASIVGTVQDITERKRAEATFEHLALYDSLTDLCNRRLFQNRLAHSMAIAHRDEKLLAVCFFDLDNFKPINDNLGHPIGDELLRTVARRLKNTMRHGDIIARISGDEFALAIEGLSSVEELEMIVEKLRRRLAEPYSIHGHKIYVTASIGLALYPLDGSDRDAMMRYADAAMYQAKSLGGNSYCYYSSEMSDKSRRRLDMEYKLRHALEKNQLRLFYQPQIDVKSGAVIGTEALLRWVHPKFGLLPPAKFLSIAEDTGLIFPIARWVLKTACEQTREWREQGYGNLNVAVNMSSRQFAEDNMVEYVEQLTKQAKFDPGCLRIEINENVAMQYNPESNDGLSELKALGIQLVIDDFGSGQSSMTHLQKLPIDALNIDRSFIMNIADRERDGSTAKAIIALAHNLGLRVCAEGIETATQVEFLKKYYCDEMQGNFLCPPVPADQVTKILSDNYSNTPLSSECH